MDLPRIRVKTPFLILTLGSVVAFLGGPLAVAVLVLGVAAPRVPRLAALLPRRVSRLPHP
jgi:hypothetical protein